MVLNRPHKELMFTVREPKQKGKVLLSSTSTEKASTSRAAQIFRCAACVCEHAQKHHEYQSEDYKDILASKQIHENRNCK